MSQCLFRVFAKLQRKHSHLCADGRWVTRAQPPLNIYPPTISEPVNVKKPALSNLFSLSLCIHILIHLRLHFIRIPKKKKKKSHTVPKAKLNCSSSALLLKGFFWWSLLCLWTRLWHSSPWDGSVYWFGFEAAPGTCCVSFRICAIAHPCTAPKINCCG